MTTRYLFLAAVAGAVTLGAFAAAGSAGGRHGQIADAGGCPFRYTLGRIGGGGTGPGSIGIANGVAVDQI